MDHLEFKIEEENWDDGKKLAVNIFINSKNLIEMLRDYETPLATNEGHPDIAGGYIGMNPESFLYTYLNPDMWDDGARTILECSGCGEYGCWPMQISVVEGKDYVEWNNFNQPHRDSESRASYWDYKDFPSFKFSKVNYEEEIEKIKLFNTIH